ncbi:MAG: hypothetical protein Kow0068_03060 [Marinilabiliales bacterium]
MLLKVFILSLVLITISIVSFSQGEIVENRMFNRDERTGAFMLTSSGWGLNFRFGKRIDGTRKTLYDIDFTEIKHPKEEKVTNPNPRYADSRKYIFGKLYYFYNLKFSYGRQKELFSKFDKGGIAIKYYYGLGANIGLLKPIYYEVVESDPSTGRHIISIEKFSDAIHTIYDIYGKAPFTEGINETKIRPGISGKFGLSFEYGETNETINALEVGTILDFYFSDIQIMAYNPGTKLLFSLFVAYRFGKTYGSI